LRLRGLGDDGLLALLGAADFPELTVVRERDAAPDYDNHIEPHFAAMTANGYGVHIDRAARLVRMHGPQPPSDDEAVHPGLSRVAAVYAHWRRQVVLHGGSFAVAGGGWGLLAGREGGKSTLLAVIARRGHEVLSDDLLVVDGDGAVLAGPRCVDLREGAAEALGIAASGGGRDGRARLRLAPVAARVQLRGVVHLRFGRRCAVTPVPIARRIELLREHALMRTAFPPDPHGLLRMAALPTFELVRPRDLKVLEESAATLLGALAH
jgi:hypothetical protein